MLKPGQNPAGLFAQAQGMGDGEMNTFVEHCFRANYSTVSIMDNLGLCSRVKNRVPDCDVVFRASGFEPAPSGDNKKALNTWFQTIPDRRIRLMVNCENGFTADRVKMAMDHITAAEDDGRKLLVLNTGSGTVKGGQLRGDGTHEPNEWLTIGAPLLQFLSTRPTQAIGVHNYTSVFAWIVSNGTYAFGDPHKSPVIDWKLAQWHIGRDLQGIVEACKVLKVNLPSLIVSECWVDQMNDIQENPSNPYHMFKSNRWRNLIEPWKQIYPGLNAENILADQFYWTWENVFSVYGNVIGMHFFTYLSTALSQGEWKDDDVANAPQFLKRQEAYHPSVVQSPSQPPPTPPPPIVIIPPVVIPSPREADIARMLLLLRERRIIDAEINKLADRLSQAA